MKSHRAALRVEELDARALPSSLPLTRVPPQPPSASNSVLVRPTGAPKFTGVAGGVYISGQLQPGDPTAYAFLGVADLAHVGHVRMNGAISASPAANGRATGIVNLSSLRGSLVIKLTGPQQAKNAPLPTHFAYTVISASGIYGNMQSTGTADLTLNATGGTFTLKFTPA